MTSEDPIQYGKVKASYFWDDGSGINGDTGAPASGDPMQKGLFASPSWPFGTEGYVEYNGKKADFFIGDRGPGDPAQNCDVLLDLDGETFAELTGESWNTESYTVSGGNGHIDVEYYITKWGDGAGNEGAPHAMGEEGSRCENAVSELPNDAKEEPDDSDEEEQSEAEAAQQEKAEQQKEKLAELDEKKAEAETKKKELAAQRDGVDDSEEGIDAAAGDTGGDQHTQTEEAASGMSGIELASNDAPLAAGVLTLAVLPVLIAALLFARWHTAPKSLGFGAGTSSGRHRRGRELPVDRLRRLLPGSGN